jgi:hypothetical protein
VLVLITDGFVTFKCQVLYRRLFQAFNVGVHQVFHEEIVLVYDGTYWQVVYNKLIAFEVSVNLTETASYDYYPVWIVVGGEDVLTFIIFCPFQSVK